MQDVFVLLEGPDPTEVKDPIGVALTTEEASENWVQLNPLCRAYERLIVLEKYIR